jgi:hypothetical protein
MHARPESAAAVGSGG